MAKKGNKHRKKNLVRVAKPVAEVVCETLECPAAENWETTPPCDETGDAEPIAETVYDAVACPAAENWETTPPCDETGGAEPVSETVGKHAVTAGYDSYNVSTPGIHEYDQPETSGLIRDI
ncbi:hypothetical protein AnigIFM60653_001086 [Aspergillus niger]|nr:hypothetical protein ALUC_50106S [Aspergillus luchuensis]GKZ98246.1 hypothetical protein AnigIFM59636_002479 [Aspergillus niger]GLA09955.1 hypothetical protein AnigIFM60653_001086 [Aspergillus niger]